MRRSAGAVKDGLMRHDGFYFDGHGMGRIRVAVV
jgi:hypothetical protein